MTGTGWNFADVFERIADRIPDALAQQQGDRTHTWADFDQRADGVAAALLAAGLSEQDKVAQYLYNCPEYLECMLACFKAGMATVNTNYRYAPDELVYLWDNADVVAVVFHGTFTAHDRAVPRPRARRARCGCGSTTAAAPCPPWATPYEAAAAPPTRPHRRAVGPLGRPSDPALHRRHHRHAEGCDVAPGRRVRRARLEQQAPHAAGQSTSMPSRERVEGRARRACPRHR